MKLKLLPAKKIILPNGKIVEEKYSATPFVIVLLAGFIYLSAIITDFNIEILIERIGEFFTIILQMIPPNWEYLSNIWQPLLDTIKMSLFGSFLGAVCALPLAMIAAQNINKIKWVSAAMKFIFSLLRTLPTLIVALVATYVFGLGTVAGTTAIFIFSVAYIGKLLYEQVENADMSAYEAMTSMGLTTIQSFRYAVLPQILPNYLSTSLFCFEGNVRYAAILGYVGAGGIGLLLNESLGWRNYANVGMILLLLVVTVFIIETISEYYRKKFM